MFLGDFYFQLIYYYAVRSNSLSTSTNTCTLSKGKAL